MGAWGDLGESGTCGDTCQSDVIDDGTFFSRRWSGVRSVAPESTVIRDADRSPSEPISGNTRFSDMVALVPDNSGVANYSPSEISDS